MTSVRNHRPQLSGNKWFILVLALIIGACSPKVRTAPSSTVKTTTEKPAEKKEEEKPPVKAAEVKSSVISLILPLVLDNAAAGKTYSAADLKKADMGVEYYQGFKLALDSLTATGANYKLQVFDSKDDAAQAHSLGINPQVKNSELVVGPIFPEDIKAFAAMLTSPRKPIISPLSPAAPCNIQEPEFGYHDPAAGVSCNRGSNLYRQKYKAKKGIHSYFGF
jgi:hypothetical protein